MFHTVGIEGNTMSLAQTRSILETKLAVGGKNIIIVLVKSLRNCKRCNKGNFTLKYNLSKIMLCGVGGQHYLVLDKILKNLINF